MFKKAIACVLSAVMCSSVLLSDAQLLRTTPQEPAEKPAVSQTESGLVGRNSFARYLAQQESTVPAAQPLRAAAAEPRFQIGNLDFDSETGQIRAVSTQSEPCTLEVSFINEDAPADIYRLTYDVAAGENMLTEGIADRSALPAYYTVRAQLVNRIGLAVSQPFVLEIYTRSVQEIIAKDVTDFEAEQVVNFDADETTNFAVLSADTVRAETTPDSNTLVSADYDHNVYVFAQIDDCIRSLKKGQYFYIQPTEEDIIAVTVQDITVEGDTATVTGDSSADPGEIFEFIKVETVTESTEYMETTDPRIIEQVRERSYRSGNVRTDGLFGDIIDGIRGTHEEAVDTLSENIEDKYMEWSFNTEATLIDAGPLEVKAAISVPFQCRFNHYKSFDDVHIYFRADYTLECKVTGSLSKEFEDGKEYKIDPDQFERQGVPEMLKQDPPDPETHLFHHAFPTPIAGLSVILNVDLVIELNFELSFGWSKHYQRGFSFDSDTGLTPIHEDQPLKLNDQNSIEGSVKIELSAEIELNFIQLVDAALAIHGALTVSAEVEHQRKKLDMNDKLESGNYIYMPEEPTDEDAIHACDGGVNFKLDVTVSADLTVGIGFKLPEKNGLKLFTKILNKLRFELKVDLFEITYHIGEFHLAVNKDGLYKGLSFHKAPCPNLAYKTTFVLNGSNLPSGTTAVLRVDKDSYVMPVSANAHLTFYAVPGKHSYALTVNPGRSNSQTLDREYVKEACASVIEIPLTFTYSDDKDPQAVFSDPTGTNGKPVIQTTAPPQTVSIPSQTAAKPSAEYLNKEIVKLGDNIHAVLSNDGSVSVSGYGDMYDFDRCPFGNIAKIYGVEIENQNEDEGLVINNIGANVFAGGSQLAVVYLPQSITTIGAGAFRGCENLQYLRYHGAKDTSKTFVLPEKLTAVGDNAFHGCASAAFGKLTFPKTVQAIGEAAFANCTGITEVTVPGDSKPVLSGYIFSGCTGIRKAVLGDGIQSIGYFLFANCINLEDLTVPYCGLDPAEPGNRLYEYFNAGAGEGLYRVYYKPTPASAYTGYLPEKLTSVTVTGGTVIPPHFFQDVTNLEHVSYPDNITEIGAYAFDGCENLEQISLPDTLTTIGGYAFRGCKTAAFGDLTLPKSIQLIGDSAFSGCLGITAVTVPGDSQPVLEPSIFSDCTGIRKAVLGDGIQSIGYFLFANCINMESLTVPCFGLDPAEPGNRLYEYFNAGGGEGLYRVYYKPTPASAYTGYLPEKLTSVTVTGGTVIPPNFFQSVSELRHVSYPDTITEIGAYAFDGCEKLEKIRLPDTLTTIGSAACRGCKEAAFGDITFPKSLQMIGGSAFEGCLGITAVTIQGDSQPVLEGSVFSGCTNLRRAVLGDGIQSMGSFMFASCVSLEELTLPYCGFNENEIGNSLFEWFNMNEVAGMYRVYYRSTVMNSYSGYVPEALKKVTITGGVSVPVTFFQNMEKLESITLHAGIGSVQENAFRSCTGLSEAYLIGENADWDNVEIIESGNEPLLALVRKASPVVMLAQPSDVTAAPGETVSFHVAAAGKYALSYLWQSSGDGGSTWGKAGSTDDTLTFAAADVHNGRVYRCIVTDEKGNEVISAAARLTVTAKTKPERPEGYNPGDLNGDGSIDVSDAVLLARFVAEDASAPVTDIGVLNADVNGDGNADMLDVTMILMFIARKIRVFPVS